MNFLLGFKVLPHSIPIDIILYRDPLCIYFHINFLTTKLAVINIFTYTIFFIRYYHIYSQKESNISLSLQSFIRPLSFTAATPGVKILRIRCSHRLVVANDQGLAERTIPFGKYQPHKIRLLETRGIPKSTGFGIQYTSFVHAASTSHSRTSAQLEISQRPAWPISSLNSCKLSWWEKIYGLHHVVLVLVATKQQQSHRIIAYRLY